MSSRVSKNPTLPSSSIKKLGADFSMPTKKVVEVAKNYRKELEPFYPYRDANFNVLVQNIVQSKATMMYRPLNETHFKKIMTQMIPNLIQKPKIAELVPWNPMT
jgi:hypothetical protein